MLGFERGELLFAAMLVVLIGVAPYVGPLGEAVGGWLHRRRRP